MFHEITARKIPLAPPKLSALRFIKGGIIIILLIFFASQKIFADTHYVSLTGGNNPPYTNWPDAANNIQDAVDAAVDGDTVLVTNGLYQTGGEVTPGYSLLNRVMVIPAITVRSVNGPDTTTILGKGPIGNNAVRCVYLTNGAQLIGFTLSEGHTRRLGDSNYEKCGGAAFLNNGGIVSNCFIRENDAQYRGGGIICYKGGLVNNCKISMNSAGHAGEDIGAGVACYQGGTVNKCTISDNSTFSAGGGVSLSGNGGSVNECIISGNSAYRGGGVFSYSFGTVNNCLIISNSASQYGGGVYGDWGNIVNNCTIIGNSSSYGGGVYGGGLPDSHGYLTNCIIYFNIATENGQNILGISSISYSCCPELSGNGNITNNPQFVNLSGNNYRLQSTSPCIDAGTNMSWMWSAKDLDGNPRIIDGIVDMGAYEYVPEPVLFVSCYLIFTIYYFFRKKGVILIDN
ncbi:hypothetical protein KAH27_06155 [bacterium]|nr:hypothetical protein [bacterium]